MSVKTRKLLPAAFVVLAAALATVPALAAPDKTGTLNAETVEFKWDGGPKNGADPVGAADCGAPNHDCDYILLKLEVGGDLKVTIGEPDDTTSDLDLFLYKSTPAGEPTGAALGSSAGSTAVESVSKSGLAAGDYVAVVEYFVAIEGTYKGKATFTPAETSAAGGTAEATATATVAATPPRATPTATPSPAPDHVVLPPPAQSSSKKSSTKPRKKQSKRQKCLAKAKKIKNASKRKAARKKCTAKKRKRS